MQHEDVLQEMDRRRDEARQPHLDDGVGEHVNQHEKERSEEEELVLVAYSWWRLLLIYLQH